VEAAQAIMTYGVGVKCATITPNQDRVVEYTLQTDVEKPQRNHPGHARRDRLPQAIFVKNIRPFVTTWKRPILIGRHAYGDVYDNSEMAIPARDGGAHVHARPGGRGGLAEDRRLQGTGIPAGTSTTPTSRS